MMRTWHLDDKENGIKAEICFDEQGEFVEFCMPTESFVDLLKRSGYKEGSFSGN